MEVNLVSYNKRIIEKLRKGQHTTSMICCRVMPKRTTIGTEWLSTGLSRGLYEAKSASNKRLSSWLWWLPEIQIIIIIIRCKKQQMLVMW